MSIVALWSILYVAGTINKLILPSPLGVSKEVVDLFVNGSIWPDLGATVLRMLIGFLLAVVFGIPVGLLLGYFSRLYSSFHFVIDFFRSVPGTALFPLFVLAFGIGDRSKVANVVFAAGLIIVVNVIYGVKNSNPRRILAARVMKARPAQIFRRVVLPEALPEIVGGIRIALSISLIIVIVTEMFFGTNVGLGRRIFMAQEFFRTEEMYAVILITGFLGFAMNRLFEALERRKVHWAGK